MYDAIDRYIGKPGDDQLTRIADTAKTSPIRHRPQTLDGVVDGPADTVRRFRVAILFNVSGDCFQVGYGVIGPFNPRQERSRCSSQART